MTGLDSRDAEQIIADALDRWERRVGSGGSESTATVIAHALRAAGLLPGPDTTTVNREDLRTGLDAGGHKHPYPDDAPEQCAVCNAQIALRSALDAEATS